MKSSTVILALVSLASANLFAPRADSTTTSVAPVTTTYSISPTVACINACKPGDVNCEAACVGSAHPNSLQVNQTNDCVAKCPQGDGSTSANVNYGVCVQACINSYYPTSQTVGPVSVGSGSTTGVPAGTTSGASKAGTGSGTATTGTSATGAGAATTSSSKAAGVNNAPYIASAGGLVGLFLAFVAL